VLGFFGIVIVIGWKNLAFDTFIPQILIVSAGISYALASVFGKKFHKRKIKLTVVAAGQLIMSSFILLLVALLFSEPVAIIPPAETWLAVLGFSAISTTFAYIIYFYLLPRIGANNVILVTVLAPVNAIILGVLFLKEVLLLQHLVGLVVIAIALMIIDKRIFTIFQK
jgi:drug/metabolite transporter (DMT)-like permease